MRFLTGIFLALLISQTALAQSYTVQSVPNTKLINNSYVSNPDGLLQESTVSEINQLLDSLEKKTTAQVAVVMLNSIGDADPFDFAQELFRYWGIGGANKDNGLLILYVQDKRTIRFHTGYGLEGVLPDAICKRIQTQKMVPFFKEGNIDAGMLAGIQEVNRIVVNPENRDEIKETGTEADLSYQAAVSILFVFFWFFIGLIIFFVKRKRFSNSRLAPKDVPTASISSGQWFLWYYLLPIAFAIVLPYAKRWDVYVGGMYAYLGLLNLSRYGRIVSRANQWLKKGEYHKVHTFLNENKNWLGQAIFFPLPFAFLIRPFKRKIEAVRIYPRNCHSCSKPMTRLDEATEDPYLSKEFQFEETLKSVDYDVWKCTACNSVSIERYPTEKTQYYACQKCKTIAQYVESSSVLSEATTHSYGEEEIIELCKFCGNRQRTLKTIPMIATASDDSSSSSSSSSSDSGGSWGGGDSGGGGASSSW